MSNVPIHSGWHDLDEEVVPVRSGERQSATPAIRYADRAGETAVMAHPNTLSMKLSAITGVAIVLAITGFYFGIDSLRGSLTGGTPAVTTVTITSDGHFSPASVTLTAGTQLSVTNLNADPQVLKVKTGNELFPVQVIFNGTPFTFTVPASVTGTFHYFSETLPGTEELTIIVTAPMETSGDTPIPFGTAQGEIPLPFGTQPAEIPLPFGAPTAYEIPIPFGKSSSSSSTSSSSSSSSSGGGSSGGGGGSSGGSGGGGSSGGGGGGGGYIYTTGNPSPQIPTYTNAIPTNPYTVAAASNNATRSEELAEAEKNVQDLHEGAEITTKRPTSVSKTGGELWLALIPAFGLMLLAYRRMRLA